ncbi:DNA-processing protein DprA [Kocuria sp. M1R5S2]|uniref:DNA-processing protein DprA n=1 Tax=Kocuria rhizosphaerae TaxID=3376285 RepID=UPI0037BB065A
MNHDQPNTPRPTEDPARLARAGLCRLAEPMDTTAMLLLAALGPVAAFEIATASRPAGTAEHAAFVRAAAQSGGSRRQADLRGGLERWSARARDLDPARDLETAARAGAWWAVPEDPDWPPALADLGLFQPVGLWGRGDRRLLPFPADRSVALVGARDCSTYGRQVAMDLAGTIAARGWTVVSGGAVGIDEAAHSAALATGTGAPSTVAVMAGGIDRLYPSAHQDLFAAVQARGLLLSEAAPGAMPSRYRFLQRNRIIAALAAGTVVVEARWRSGSQSTARHAEGLSRAVGAVPGSVHSGTSAGCHRLLREGTAVLVTDAEEVLELIQPLGTAFASEPTLPRAPEDGLGEPDRRLLESLPLTVRSRPDHLARVAGLAVRDVLGGLRRLEERGLADATPEGWRRRDAALRSAAPELPL